MISDAAPTAAGHDLIGIAATGSGKTLTFVRLPCLSCAPVMFHSHESGRAQPSSSPAAIPALSPRHVDSVPQLIH